MLCCDFAKLRVHSFLETLKFVDGDLKLCSQCGIACMLFSRRSWSSVNTTMMFLWLPCLAGGGGGGRVRGAADGSSPLVSSAWLLLLGMLLLTSEQVRMQQLTLPVDRYVVRVVTTARKEQTLRKRAVCAPTCMRCAEPCDRSVMLL